ncbi:hypothetical protein DSM101010T_15450 [Desulfovibrio subterraneus]|uniref:Uncharacterized protein n=1 Tax=Desulfovibrio subterraneus TaxID=2718620 RepID=A0A7J0BHI6_9BACT|nr:hypothetical protein DSM101010T_15450 [Desulfovibrio subterraneus]
MVDAYGVCIQCGGVIILAIKADYGCACAASRVFNREVMDKFFCTAKPHGKNGVRNVESG